MYDHILIPVDFDHAEMNMQAVEVARKLLNPDGKITVLHVVPDLPGYVAVGLPPELLTSSHDAAVAETKALAAKMGSDCQPRVVRGHAGREILAVAEGSDAQCVVISSHKPGVQDYLMGSTAGWVVRHAPCCVHVLR